jgi:hypothetical protein
MEPNNLTFFTDVESNKSIKIGISTIVGRISTQISSHKAGWAAMIRDQLIEAGYENVKIIHKETESWEDLDVLLFEHGMEYKGTFNIFGGANDDLYRQLIRILTPNLRMYSLHVDMPNISDLIRVRLKSGTELFKTIEPKIDDIEKVCLSVPRVDFIQKTDKQIFGDSHSFSLYTPGSMCTRYDGLTMHGALSRGLSSYVFPWTKHLAVYIGNIDIRHHLMRQQDPLKSIDIMIADMEKQLIDVNMESVSVRHVLPVENESRKIPKTGFYKGTGFMGTRAERGALSTYMNIKISEMCERNNWNCIENPAMFFNDLGELTFSVMEKPQSVHISREFHIWDYETRQLNQRIL